MLILAIGFRGVVFESAVSQKRDLSRTLCT
jgi:hypothetical protein